MLVLFPNLFIEGGLAADERCPRVLVVKPEMGGKHILEDK